jgi:hypothetical protein
LVKPSLAAVKDTAFKAENHCPAGRSFCRAEIQNLLILFAFQKISNCMPPETTSSQKPKLRRARSLPFSKPFTVAVIFSALHYLALISTLIAWSLFCGQRNEFALKMSLAAIGFSAITWFIAFFKRRAALCPLCRGTPLINSGALAHSRATRLPGLNHGVSATLSIIATQTFRCMYCGSDFDLLKTPSHLRASKPDTRSK